MLEKDCHNEVIRLLSLLEDGLAYIEVFDLVYFGFSPKDGVIKKLQQALLEASHIEVINRNINDYKRIYVNAYDNNGYINFSFIIMYVPLI